MEFKGSSYRPQIDGLRAVAVLSVIAFHYGADWLPGGFLGVDIFFVISGFLITRNIRSDLAAGTFSLGDFYLRRVRRIIPALLVTIAVTFAAFAVVASPQKLVALADTALASVLSVSNVYFFVHSGYFDADSLTQPLLHTWSLGVEEQFYFAWPFLILLTARRGVAFGSVAVLIGALSLVASQYFLARDASAVFYLTPFRAFEFAIGGFVTALPERNRKVREMGFAIGAALIGASLLALSKASHMPGVASLLPCSGAALIIHCGRSTLGAALRGSAVVFVGRISYSLYLVHWPVIVFAQYLAMRDLSGSELLAALAVTGLLACGLFYLIETPFRSRRGSSFAIPPARLIGSTIVTALVIVGASLSARSDGWSWRLGERSALFSGIVDPQTFHLTYYGGRGCANGGCQSSPSAKRRIYVLGDSYARAYYTGLVAALPEINFVFFVANGCPFYSIKFTAVTTEGAEICDSARSKAFAEIKADPSDVIITQDWAIYTYRMQTAGKERIRIDNDMTKFAGFVSEQLADFKKTLLPNNKLLVIGGVPQFRTVGTPFDCLGRPGRPRCDDTSTSDKLVSQHLRFNTALAGLQGFDAFIDPFDYLCFTSVCRNFDGDGKPIYSDQGHLSEWGSKFLVNAMLPALRAPDRLSELSVE